MQLLRCLFGPLEFVLPVALLPQLTTGRLRQTQTSCSLPPATCGTSLLWHRGPWAVFFCSFPAATSHTSGNNNRQYSDVFDADSAQRDLIRETAIAAPMSQGMSSLAFGWPAAATDPGSLPQAVAHGVPSSIPDVILLGMDDGNWNKTEPKIPEF